LYVREHENSVIVLIPEIWGESLPNHPGGEMDAMWSPQEKL